VSSATNIVTPGAAGKEGSKAPRPNPIALEVMVSVTGAKASGESGARDLFTEETTTVLVFKDGAVIRLAAPVNVGQLLFLTSRKSNQEVVCQVLHKKSFKPNSNYVELQFTEEREDYWGVAFPEQGKNTPEFKVTEQVQAEEITADETEEPAEPHSAEAVEQLKSEVEALREQLAELQKKHVQEAAEKAMAEAAAAQETAEREAAMRNATKVIEAASGNLFKAREELAPVNEPGPEAKRAGEEKPALLMPTATKDTSEVPRAVIGMTLPMGKKEKVAEQEASEQAAEELLPRPALDFSQMPKGEAAAGVMSGASGVGKARRLGLSVVLLLALAGGAWYGKWWQALPLGKSAPMATPGNVKKPVAARSAAGNVSIVTATATKAEGKDSGKSGPTDAQNIESGPADAAGENAEEPARKPTSREKAASKRNSQKTAEETRAEESVAADAPLQPAKLLKPANPVYPPDAMRSYITGDVKAEVVVDSSGRVGDVKVISGPKALRQAAVEALKQYSYAPATQGGKAVESTAMEVVKFWFNP
jgi:TonB family protein